MTVLKMFKGSSSAEGQKAGILPTASNEMTGCFKLSYRKRISAFVTFFVVGAGFLVLCSTPPMMAKPTKLGTLYILGTICCCLASTFLLGPKRQLKMMFKKSRIVATLILFLTMGLMFYACFFTRNWAKVARKFFILSTLCLQLLAQLWFGLSFIPYTRKFVMGCANKTITTGPFSV